MQLTVQIGSLDGLQIEGGLPLLLFIVYIYLFLA